jgi:hypothetical protein
MLEWLTEVDIAYMDGHYCPHCNSIAQHAWTSLIKGLAK